MTNRVWTARRTLFGLLVLFLALGAFGAYFYRFSQIADGVDCPQLDAPEVVAMGLDFNHRFPSVMRDPVNGILVVAAVGQPYTDCKMILSTFRCTATGPGQVRVIAGQTTMFFDVPEGQTAILQGAGSGWVSCTLPRPGEPA